MPKEDPAPIEGGALHFFATEYCAIIGTFARHGHADLPLHIADAVDALLAEVKQLREAAPNKREHGDEGPLPTIGNVYRHYEHGHLYKVIGFATDSEDLSTHVLYLRHDQPLEGALHAWDRRLADWNSPAPGGAVRFLLQAPAAAAAQVLLIGGHKAQAIATLLRSGGGPAVTRANTMEQAIYFARSRGPFTLAVMVEGGFSDEEWRTLGLLIPDSVFHNGTPERIADYIRTRCAELSAQPATTPINSPNDGKTAGGA